MVSLAVLVVRCDDDDDERATEVPVVAPPVGWRGDGPVVAGGGGGGGIRRPADVGGILAGVSPPSMSIPRSIATACRAECAPYLAVHIGRPEYGVKWVSVYPSAVNFLTALGTTAESTTQKWMGVLRRLVDPAWRTPVRLNSLPIWPGSGRSDS